MNEELFALSDGKKQLSKHLIEMIDSLTPKFKKFLEINDKNSLPESIRKRLALSKSLFEYGNYTDSLEKIQGISLLFSGISNNDPAIVNTYNLVSFDDSGREIFLNSLESKNTPIFYQRYYDFSGHVISRDLNRIGAGAKKSIMGDYLSAMENFIYLGLKTSILSKIISEGSIGAIKSILSCRSESDLKEICTRNYLSSDFNSAKFQLEKDHASIQSAISERFDISPILSILGLGILEDKKSKIPIISGKSKNILKPGLKNILIRKTNNRPILKNSPVIKNKKSKKK